MNFYSTRELRTVSKEMWESLRSEGELVITSNGHPSALMIDLSNGDFERTLKAVRQARAMLAFNRMRERAAQSGFLSADDIESEIAAYRAEKKETE